LKVAASKRLRCLKTATLSFVIEYNTKYEIRATRVYATPTETSEARRHKFCRVKHLLLRGRNGCAQCVSPLSVPVENINATSSMLHKQWVKRRIYHSQRGDQWTR